MVTDTLGNSLEMLDLYNPPRRDAAALEAGLRAICSHPEASPQIKAYAADVLLRAGLTLEG